MHSLHKRSATKGLGLQFKQHDMQDTSHTGATSTPSHPLKQGMNKVKIGWWAYQCFSIKLFVQTSRMQSEKNVQGGTQFRLPQQSDTLH